MTMTDNIHLIQPASLSAKRQALNLLAQHADAMTVTEVVRLLADPAPDVALDEALRPLVRFAEEEDLGAAIAMLTGDDNLAEDYSYEALKLLARHATAKQLHAAILACVATPERLNAAINAFTEDDESDDDVKPLRAVG